MLMWLQLRGVNSAPPPECCLVDGEQRRGINDASCLFWVQDEYKHLLRGSRLELFPSNYTSLVGEGEREGRKRGRVLHVTFFPPRRAISHFMETSVGLMDSNRENFFCVNSFLNWSGKKLIGGVERSSRYDQFMEKWLLQRGIMLFF